MDTTRRLHVYIFTFDTAGRLQCFMFYVKVWFPRGNKISFDILSHVMGFVRTCTFPIYSGFNLFLWYIIPVHFKGVWILKAILKVLRIALMCLKQRATQLVWWKLCGMEASLACFSSCGEGTKVWGFLVFHSLPFISKIIDQKRKLMWKSLFQRFVEFYTIQL